jgi:Icc-related predicted phosphoesterase
MSAHLRILALSDLHLEFAPFVAPDPALFDIVVLAGDISVGIKAVLWASRPSTFAGKPVVLVPGNHEFYGGERTRMLELLRAQAAGTNVHLLDRDEVILNGVRFLGATLWTDFELDIASGTSVEQAMRDATQGLNDFAGSIRERVLQPPGKRLFSPEDALREHRLSRTWLHEQLQVPVGREFGATVVVTHHAPSSQSMDPIYEGSDLNPCYYSDLPEDFFACPALWVHGHTHSSSDYRHHGTRIVCNPRGYRRRNGAIENARFDPSLVITLESGVDHV